MIQNRFNTKAFNLSCGGDGISLFPAGSLHFAESRYCWIWQVADFLLSVWRCGDWYKPPSGRLQQQKVSDRGRSAGPHTGQRLLRKLG